MKVINTKCPACKAEPKEPCRDVGFGDEPRTSSGFHVSRKRRAHYETIAARLSRNAAIKKGV